MSIKLILNSYYRSGSTYFFDAVRNNNPDLKCYYEPLNPGLSKMIDSKMNKFGLHKGYGYSDILEHYYLLSSDITSKIYRNLPMMSQGSFLDINIKNYMDIFDQMDGDVFLQTNNLHFHLDLVHDLSDARIIHLVRSPVDVLSSVLSVPLNRSSFLKQQIKSASSSFGFFQPFNLAIEYEYVQSHYNSVDKLNYSWREKINMLQLVNRFMTVWVESNFRAVQSVISNQSSLLIFYDHFFGGNQIGFIGLEKYLRGCSVRLSNVPSIVDKVNNVDKKSVELVNRKVDELGLREKFDFIVSIARKYDSIIGDIF